MNIINQFDVRCCNLRQNYYIVTYPKMEIINVNALTNSSLVYLILKYFTHVKLDDYKLYIRNSHLVTPRTIELNNVIRTSHQRTRWALWC